MKSFQVAYSGAGLYFQQMFWDFLDIWSKEESPDEAAVEESARNFLSDETEPRLMALLLGAPSAYLEKVLGARVYERSTTLGGLVRDAAARILARAVLDELECKRAEVSSNA